jgi:hypothetical protein
MARGRDTMRKTFVLASAVVFVVSLAVPVLSPRNGVVRAASVTGSSDVLGDEAAIAMLEDQATAAGALGVYRDDKAGALVVRVASDRMGTFALGESTSGGLPVVTRASSLDAPSLARAQDKIATFLASGGAGDNYLTYYDAKLDKIVLNSNARDAEVTAALGADKKSFALRSGGLERVASRLSDVAPFWGGAAVTDGNYGCSLNFTVLVGSNEEMITAGHCFDFNNVPVWSIGNGNSMGTYGSRHCSSGQDGALIDGKDYGPQVYVGGASSTTGNLVKGSGNPVAGVDYWWSAYVTNENPTTAISTTGSGNWGCGNATGLVVVQNTEREHCAALEGDSGGSFYLKVGTNLYARGILVAKAADGSTCSVIKWSTLASYLGAVIETG